jgi:hypothetical protein
MISIGLAPEGRSVTATKTSSLVLPACCASESCWRDGMDSSEADEGLSDPPNEIGAVAFGC